MTSLDIERERKKIVRTHGTNLYGKREKKEARVFFVSSILIFIDIFFQLRNQNDFFLFAIAAANCYTITRERKKRDAS